jgi:hypothetical protein
MKHKEFGRDIGDYRLMTPVENVAYWSVGPAIGTLVVLNIDQFF